MELDELLQKAEQEVAEDTFADIADLHPGDPRRIAYFLQKALREAEEAREEQLAVPAVVRPTHIGQNAEKTQEQAMDEYIARKYKPRP